MSEKQNRNRTRQAFLKTFFDEDGYQEKEVNGFWLVQHYNGDTGGWEIAIYSSESFKNYNKVHEAQEVEHQTMSLLDRILKNG